MTDHGVSAEDQQCTAPLDWQQLAAFAVPTV
jgi:hypothetical protein